LALQSRVPSQFKDSPLHITGELTEPKSGNINTSDKKACAKAIVAACSPGKSALSIRDFIWLPVPLKSARQEGRFQVTSLFLRRKIALPLMAENLSSTDDDQP